MKTRYGDEMATHQHAITLGKSVTFNDVAVTFFPAGHILGSTQILIEYSGYRVVVSGDYNVATILPARRLKLSLAMY